MNYESFIIGLFIIQICCYRILYLHPKYLIFTIPTCILLYSIYIILLKKYFKSSDIWTSINFTLSIIFITLILFIINILYSISVYKTKNMHTYLLIPYINIFILYITIVILK
jgi:hypothetical protein